MNIYITKREKQLPVVFACLLATSRNVSNSRANFNVCSILDLASFSTPENSLLKEKEIEVIDG